MSITVSELLKLPVFQTARLLSGKEGTSRVITRISVFDCPAEPDDAEIIHVGDAFISGLSQFNENASELVGFIRFLYRLDSSCLFVTDENIRLFDEAVLGRLADIPYPVLCLPKKISYAEILEAVNNQLLFNNFYMVTELTLDKIFYSNVSGTELGECISRINSSFMPHIAALSVNCGQAQRTFLAGASHLVRKTDLLTPYKHHYLFIVSDPDMRLLTRRIAFLKGKLAALFPDIHCGISPAYALSDIKNAVFEADFLMAKSNALNQTFCESGPADIFDVLLAYRHDKNLMKYYQRLCKTIQSYDKDGHLELLRTIQEFVLCRGNYRETALRLTQHENTIRYRMNKLRSLLAMDDDEILFHETISIFVKLRLLLQEEQ